MSAVSEVRSPRLLVLSSLFPSAAQPAAGAFIRERMFRVGKHVPIVVVAPQAWFPLQGLIRRFRPHFRPMAPRFEVMQGFEVHRPRFLCFPGILKWTDGFFMAVSSLLTVRRLVRKHAVNVLDVHFGYPDGEAGRWLARWVGLPMTLTLRGKEERQNRTEVGPALRRAIRAASEVITVSEALRKLAIDVGADPAHVTMIGNGVDLARFTPLPRPDARAALGLADGAKVMVSVGTLVERKGFHRVIECLPALLERHPDLHYLVVGGPGPEGDITARLRAQVAAAGLEARVHFLGIYSADRLRIPLSASDIFVLATGYEGWANVFLEAMGCGLPVVTTRVGGNPEVINRAELGTLVEFGDRDALERAIDDALTRDWDRARIIEYARSNAWEQRIPAVVAVFERLLARRSRGAPRPASLGTERA